VARSATSPFVRAVNRAFADALVVEARRCHLGRQEMAAKCGISRAYLQHLLAAKGHPSIGSLILIAEGLGMNPDQLLRNAMEHLSRIRACALPPVDPAP
jgi:transcriptional regulator with XRE-family HTH domain